MKTVSTDSALPSTVIGSAARAGATEAALVNGTSAHALDFDDSCVPALLHPSAVLAPAILAVGEALGSSGTAIVDAYAVAYEATLAVGELIKPAYTAGFHATGTVGVVGAATGVGALLGFNADEMSLTLGMAASFGSGLRANFGTDAKPIHAGRAAQAGVQAGLFVSSGGLASTNIIEAEHGLTAVFAPQNLSKISSVIERLKRSDFTVDANPPTIKQFASCGATHTTIVACLRLRKRLDIHDVQRIVITAPSLCRDVLTYHRPTTGLQAKFSLEGCAALALVDGVAGPEQFTDSSVNRPEVQSLIERASVTIVDSWDDLVSEGTSIPSKLTIDTGRETIECVITAMPGTEADPTSLEAVMDKFHRSLSHYSLASTDIDYLVTQLTRLEDLSSIASLSKGLRKLTPIHGIGTPRD